MLILSISHKLLHVQSALDAGADGYLLKKTNKNEVLSAIHLLMEGKTFYAQNVTSSLINKSDQGKIKLTEREVEVLTLLAAGDSTKESAIKLNIGENTVKTYRNNLFQKFNVKKTIVLVTKAIKGGYL